MRRRKRARGLTLIEVLGSLAIGALLFAALGGVAVQSTRALAMTTDSSLLEQEAQFALDRMIEAVRAARVVLIPQPERAATVYSESQRALLAVSLDPTIDRDANGFVDADNDRDGRVDEDWSDDATNDGVAGIVGIDDNGDGVIDGDSKNDDEDGASNEDTANGLDDDGDGLVDEDAKRDMNDDGKPGVKSVDDDGDGSVDEGKNEDDDEDGAVDEDWLDARVFRLVGTTLVERLPDLNAANGTVFTERPIAAGVSGFSVVYSTPAAAGLPPTLLITLTLTGAGAAATVETRVRVGGLR